MSDEPATVTGGDVVRSYAGDAYPPELQSILDMALTDLAQRLDVQGSSIQVVQVQEVTWSDASLGCPEPGMSYAQMIVDGLRIVLSADGTEYDYRSGSDAVPVLCEPSDGEGAAGRDGPTLDVDVTEEGEVIVTPVPRPGRTESGPTERLDPPDE